jgi:hypothetical protein
VKLWGYNDSTEAPWCDKQMPRLGFVNPILNWFPAEEVDRAGSRTGRQNLERFDRRSSSLTSAISSVYYHKRHAYISDDKEMRPR